MPELVLQSIRIPLACEPFTVQPALGLPDDLEKLGLNNKFADEPKKNAARKPDPGQPA